VAAGVAYSLTVAQRACAPLLCGHMLITSEPVDVVPDDACARPRRHRVVRDIALHDGACRHDRPGADGNTVENRRPDPDVAARSNSAEPPDVRARPDGHVVTDFHVVPDERPAIDQHMPADLCMRCDLRARADHGAVPDGAAGRNPSGGMYDRGESQPLADRLIDEASALGAAQSADAEMCRRQTGDRVDPEHRQAVNGLATAVPIEVLDESLELERRQIAQEVCNFACKRSGAEDDEGIGWSGA